MTEIKKSNRNTGKTNSKEAADSYNSTNTDRKHEPLPKFRYQRLWSRAVVVIGIFIYVWFNSNTNIETTLAKQTEILQSRGQTFNCDDLYLKEISTYLGCIPKKCGRFVTDQLITTAEADILLKIAKKGFALGGSSGGASIFDLHSGALSYKTKFINFYTLKESKEILNHEDLAAYKLAKLKIQNAIANLFGIDADKLYLTKPTFFSKLSNVSPVTEHDRYWLPHVDKETYESFHYTSLLYLSDYEINFKGGRLIFIDGTKEKPTGNVTIEPRKGRVAMFTSGAENLHFVERVTEGIRYAITVSFTCDEKMKIPDISENKQ